MLVVYPAVIASGQSLSGAVDLESNILAGFQMPSAWDAANLTFEGSYDGVTFAKIVGTYELELGVQPATFWLLNLWQAGGQVLSPFACLGVRYLKVRSGTASSPVNQSAERTIQLLARSLGCSVSVSC